MIRRRPAVDADRGPDRLFDAARLSGDQTEDIPIVLLSVLVTFNFLLVSTWSRLPARRRPDRARRRLETHGRPRQGDALLRAARAGFAVLLVGYGILVRCGDALGGVVRPCSAGCWAPSARGAILQSAFTDRLEGITVADLMDAEPVTIPAASRPARLQDYFLRYQGWESFASSTPTGALSGSPTGSRCAHGGGGRRPTAPVGELVVRLGEEGRFPPTRRSRRCSPSEPLRRLGA